ncbi:MAG: multi-sensor signal transduction histidine kinase [Candidatus Peribacteria bacterium]|nr:multi-sensor signal transduction histidine kinase [Candidatus Peribacteria bacterium]
MPIDLPQAAENYLIESGLSRVDILVVKKLLETNQLTVRELASKTGKGTGSIDLSLKKLIRLGIVLKEKFNDQPRYTVLDPQALVVWTKKALKERGDLMNRRHQSFAQFIETLSSEKSLPAIEHFAGEDGIRKAYDRLLQNRTELLTYFDPAETSKEMAEFHAQYGRRRQVHGVFQRIIAPDSSAARKFGARDPFEYRKTVLVPSEEYQLSFGKIIAGDTVVCMDEKNNEASFIRFEKLANAERAAFERQWIVQMERDRMPGVHVKAEDETHSVSLWEQIRAMNGLQKVCTLFFFMICIYWFLLFVTQTTGGFLNYLYSFLFGLIPLFSSIPILCNVKKWGGLKSSIGRGIFCMGLSLLLWGCGSMIWSYYNFILNISIPYPSSADIGFAPSTTLYGLGVIFLSDATGARFGLKNIYAKIFAMVTPIITLIISYYFLVTIARGGVFIQPSQSAIKTFLDIQGPVGDTLALMIVILVSGLSIRHMGNKYALEIMTMLIGLFVFIIADGIYAYTTTIGTFYNGNFGDLIYTVGIFLLSFGVLGFCREKFLQ